MTAEAAPEPPRTMQQGDETIASLNSLISQKMNNCDDEEAPQDEEREQNRESSREPFVEERPDDNIVAPVVDDSSQQQNTDEVSVVPPSPPPPPPPAEQESPPPPPQTPLPQQQQQAAGGGTPKEVKASRRENGLRRGKWTVEEEAYANRLIHEFKLGLLPLTDGTTLRTFLSKLLHCDPMRISKKFVGSNCIGKQVFRRRQADMDRLSSDDIKRSRYELAELERRFLSRVAQTNRTAKANVGGSSGGGSSKPKGGGHLSSSNSHDKSSALSGLHQGQQADFPRQQPISAPWLLPPHPNQQAMQPVRATPGAGAVAIAAPYGIARGGGSGNGYYQQQRESSWQQSPIQRVGSSSASSSSDQHYHQHSRDAGGGVDVAMTPQEDGNAAGLHRSPNSHARGGEYQSQQQQQYLDSPGGEGTLSSPHGGGGGGGGSGGASSTEASDQHQPHRSSVMTRLERQQQAGGYGENLPTRGSMASFASFPSLISVDNMSENFDQSSLGMQSPWPSTNNLAQNESFNGLPKMGQSESNLAAMDTQPTSTASTAEKNRSASGGMTSWPSLTALVGAYEEDPSTNQRYAASAPGPANKSSNENAATPSVEAPVRQDEGSAANARQTQQQEEELQSAPQAQLVKTEEVTAAAGTGDGGDAVPESSSPAAPPPAQAPSDSASPPPSSPSPRVAAEATAKEEPVADVKRSPPPKPKEEERRPVPSLSRKLQSHQGSIRRQHRNSSVENFFSLVQSGDIPAPDDDLLSLPILQHISSDNPHPRQHQQPQQQQQQQKRSAGEAFNNQQDPKRSTKHAYTASRT